MTELNEVCRDCHIIGMLVNGIICQPEIQSRGTLPAAIGTTPYISVQGGKNKNKNHTVCGILNSNILKVSSLKVDFKRCYWNRNFLYL